MYVQEKADMRQKWLDLYHARINSAHECLEAGDIEGWEYWVKLADEAQSGVRRYSD